MIEKEKKEKPWSLRLSESVMKPEIRGISAKIKKKMTRIVQYSWFVSFNKKDFPDAVTYPYGLEVLTAGEFLRTWRNSQ